MQFESNQCNRLRKFSSLSTAGNFGLPVSSQQKLPADVVAVGADIKADLVGSRFFFSLGMRLKNSRGVK